jgi:hypothetical protein
MIVLSYLSAKEIGALAVPSEPNGLEEFDWH